MEAGEHALTREARFVAVCLEVVAVAGLMWVSWCVWGTADFFMFFYLILFFSSNFERTRPAESMMKAPCLIYLSTSNKKPLHTGVRTGCYYLVSLSVRLCMCNIRRFY